MFLKSDEVVNSLIYVEQDAHTRIYKFSLLHQLQHTVAFLKF